MVSRAEIAHTISPTFQRVIQESELAGQQKLHQAVAAFSQVSAEYPAVVGTQAVVLEMACLDTTYPPFRSGQELLSFLWQSSEGLLMIARAANARHASANKQRAAHQHPSLSVAPSIPLSNIQSVIKSEQTLLTWLAEGVKRYDLDYEVELARIFALHDRPPTGLEKLDLALQKQRGIARPYFDPIRTEIEERYKPSSADPDADYV